MSERVQLLEMFSLCRPEGELLRAAQGCQVLSASLDQARRSIHLEVEFAHPDAPQLADAFSRLWSQTPGLGLLNAPGTFSWLLVLASVALLRRRKGVALIACLPLWLALGICCVSPVNALVRYMLPIMAATPLLLAYTFSALGNHDKGGTLSHG